MEAIPGVQGGHTASPRSDGDTRIPPAPSGPFGDRDPPRGNKVCTMPIHPHTAADTAESLRFCLGRLGDRGAPWGYEETHTPHPTQRRIHPIPLSLAWAVRGIEAPRLGDRGAPGGYEETRTPSTPTQRHIHPSTSGPAWAVWGTGAPRGGMRRHHTIHPYTAADTPESLRSDYRPHGASPVANRRNGSLGKTCGGRNIGHTKPTGAMGSVWRTLARSPIR